MARKWHYGFSPDPWFQPALERFIRRNKKHGIKNDSDAIKFLLDKALNEDTLEKYLELKEKYDALVGMINRMCEVNTLEDAADWKQQVEEIIGEDGG